MHEEPFPIRAGNAHVRSCLRRIRADLRFDAFSGRDAFLQLSGPGRHRFSARRRGRADGEGRSRSDGLAAFSEAETRLVTAFNTDKTLGTVEGPSLATAPSTAPQRPVADALADFSREAASPAQPEPPVEEVPASVPPAAVPEQAVRTPGAQPETGIPPPPVRAETERKPLVLLVGDSMMMEGFGPVLQRTLRKRPDLEVVREGKYSTGSAVRTISIGPRSLRSWWGSTTRIWS